MTRRAAEGGGEPGAGAPSVLVVGIGSPFRGDDAAGLLAVRAYAPCARPGVEVLESPGDAVRLMELWKGRSSVIAVDAMRSGAPAGRIMRFEIPGPPLPLAAFAAGSTHAFGLGEAIQLGLQFGTLPPRLVLLGIEAEHWSFGAPLSPAVAAGIPILKEILVREVSLLEEEPAAQGA
ncbi:MAG: hydrogenase maturation protease [Bacteroidota bacterium]